MCLFRLFCKPREEPEMLLRLFRNRIVARLKAAGDIEQLIEGLLHLIAIFGSKPTPTPPASS